MFLFQCGRNGEEGKQEGREKVYTSIHKSIYFSAEVRSQGLFVAKRHC